MSFIYNCVRLQRIQDRPVDLKVPVYLLRVNILLDLLEGVGHADDVEELVTIGLPVRSTFPKVHTLFWMSLRRMILSIVVTYLRGGKKRHVHCAVLIHIRRGGALRIWRDLETQLYKYICICLEKLVFTLVIEPL